MNDAAEIYTLLDSLGVSYTKKEHDPVFTVEEADALYDDIEGVHTKNLFLKNKKGTQYYLVVIASHKRADLKAIAETIDEKKLTFCNADELKQYLGVTPGSVSIFGLVHDTERAVQLLVDTDVWEAEKVNGHPNTNTATITIDHAGLETFLAHTGHTPKVIDCG